MKEEKLLRKKNVKGSVLFTVVAVMMVMIVFVMATLTIAGAANKRAYASYSKNQTTYTAKSVLDATIQAMCSDSSIANTVAQGNGIPLTVDLPDSSMGTATVVATKVGTTKQLNTQTGLEEDKEVILLSATATLGEETSTVTNYFLVNPVETPDVPTGINKALTVLGDISNGDGINAFGGASVGISKDSNRWANQSAKQYNLISNNNPRPATGNLAINGSYKNSSSSTNAYKLSNHQGFTIFGDLFSDNSGPLSVESVVDISSGAMNYDDLPYIYVERSFDISNTTTIGREDTPIIVYCGGNLKACVDSSRSVDFYSDVYIYNHDFSLEKYDYSDFNESNKFNSNMITVTVSSSDMNNSYVNNSYDEYGVSILGGEGHSSKMLQFVASVINGTTGTTMGGNLYTEGSLKMRDATINGDCYIADDLLIEWNRSVEIKGVLTVKNDVCIKDNVKMKVGYFDVDPAKLKIENNVKINDVDYNSISGVTALEKNTNFVNEINSKAVSYTYNYVGAGAGDYLQSTTNYKNVGTGNGDYKFDKVPQSGGNYTWVEYSWGGYWAWTPGTGTHNDGYVYVGAGAGDYTNDYDYVGTGVGDYTRTEAPLTTAMSTSFPDNKTLTDVLNFVDTPQDILDEYTEQNAIGDTIYKTSDYPTTNPNVTTTVYTSDFNTKEVRFNGTRIQTAGEAGYYDTNYSSYNYINSDCTLSGNFSGTKILFNPGAGTLWVQLENVEDDASCNWVIDDSQGGTVNFYIPDNTYSNFHNNSRIWTKAYKEAIESGSYTINFYKTKTDAEGNEELDLDSSGNPQIDHTETYSNLTLYGNMPKFSDFTKYIPGINIYSGQNNAKFDFTNNTFLTGYILAPYLTGSMNTGGTNLNVDYADNIDYSLAHFNSTSTQVIGAVVIGNSFTTNNAGTFIFVAKDSTSSIGNNITIANGDTIMMYSSTYQNS